MMQKSQAFIAPLLAIQREDATAEDVDALVSLLKLLGKKKVECEYS